MQRRSAFNDYLVLAGGVIFCLALVEGAFVLQGPPTAACFCPVYPNPCHCPQPVPMGLASALAWLPQAYFAVLLALLPLSLVVTVVGIFLGQRAPATVDFSLVRALKLGPLVTTLVVEVVFYILVFYPYPLPGVLPR
jgi:hypothetical protein